jgi:hypothetical protein
MGGLKPIGSEKLQGLDKINRIMEIARYKENLPKPVNEDKSVEYKITLADGNTYRIDREKNGYVIKKGLNESFDYIEPMKNRKYYSSYSQAFKRLNLIAKEVNINEGYEKNVSLFNESDDVKYYLNLGKGGEVDEQPAAPAAAPAPAPVAAPAPAPAESPEEIPAPEGGEGMPEDDMDMPEDDMDMEEPQDDEEEVVTFKTIQKITGKLGQKIRAFLSDDENEMSSKDIKYVINSVLSALQLEDLDEEDKEEILDKIEGLGEEGEEDFDMEEPEMGDEEMGGEEMEPEVPEVPEPEMAEGFDFEDEMEFDDEDEMEFKPRGARRRRIHHDDMSDDESFKVEDMLENLFSESKVDSVLEKYFGKKVIKESVNKKETTFSKAQKLSESKSQEAASAKVLSKYPTAKLVGKTPNKDLVFEVEDKKLKVSTKGGYKLL